MKLFQLLAGKADTFDPETLETVAAGLLPDGLPSRVATLAKAEQYRAQISAIEESAGQGPVRAACRPIASACDDLTERLRLRERIAQAPKQAEADARAAKKDLESARKHRKECEQTHVEAEAATAHAEQRLQAMQATLGAASAQHQRAIADADQQLHAAIMAGDEDAETAAAAAVLHARNAARTPEHEAHSVRVTALEASHAARKVASDAIALLLRQAEDAELVAQGRFAAVAADRAACDYALALLSLQRVRHAAQTAGREQAAAAPGMAEQTIFVHDRARCWFTTPDASQIKGGVIELGSVAFRIARMLDTPVDVAALNTDPQQAAQQPEAQVA